MGGKCLVFLESDGRAWQVKSEENREWCGV